MSNKFVRIFLSVAATGVFVAVGTPARAADYSPNFDPQFNGSALFQIGDGCLQNNGTFQSTGDCQVDQIFVDLFDTNNTSVHFTGGFEADIGSQVVIAGNQLTAFSTDPGLSCPEVGPCAATYQFFTGLGENELVCDGTCEPLATLTIGTGNPLRDGYTLQRQVPEPGTLSLLLGGLGAVWLRKRRKAAA